MKASNVFVFVIAMLIAFVVAASAQTQTAVGIAPVISTITVRPDVADNCSIELWNDFGVRLQVYRGLANPLIAKDPHTLLKVVMDPSATEGDLSKDRSLKDGKDLVHLNTGEIAILVNGRGMRIKNLSKNPSETEWRTTDLDPTIFVTTQSKVKGGYSHTGISDLLSKHNGTPEGKGGSYSPALYVESYDGKPFCGNPRKDRQAYREFANDPDLCQMLGIQVQATTTESDHQSTATQPPADPAPVHAAHIDSIDGSTRITFFQNGVHLKVVSQDGKKFGLCVYHGKNVVSDDGYTIECDHDQDMPMNLSGKHQVEIFIGDKSFGHFGGN